MALFSLAAAAGLALIIIGMGRAPYVPVWYPPTWGRWVAVLSMPWALIALLGAYLPSNLKRIIRHPMLLGVAMWAASHLLANGDLASLILFGSFAAFALFDMASANRRGARASTRVLPRWRDLVLVTVGAVAYGALLIGHAWLFGVPAIMW